MQVWSLASGSSGNAYLVEADGSRVLVECGLPTAAIERALLRVGSSAETLSAILLTHDHSDHLRGARELSDRYELPVYASAGTLAHVSLRDSALARPLLAARRWRVGELEVTPFDVPHDGREPFGFRLESHLGRVAIVTDLGHLPDAALPHLLDLDLLVLEANYDDDMLRNGPYPWNLKRRINGAVGHLSNRDCGEAVARCGDRAPRELWLAHLSTTNNTPATAAEGVEGVLRERGLRHLVPQVAPRSRPGLRWSAKVAARQLPLF